MNFHSLIVDDFLTDAEKFREYAVSRGYEGVVNPQDGVLYPDISIDIPGQTKHYIIQQTQKIMQGVTHSDAVVEPKVTFMRLSTKGVHVPHQSHTDKNIADYTLLLYLSKDEDCEGGTDIVEHVDGMNIHPQTQEEIDLWRRDTNTPEQWVKVGFCPMKFNRAFILRSDLFHRAQPIGGFGDSVESGRLVLTMFFNLK